jgi:hypothetical protein
MLIKVLLMGFGMCGLGVLIWLLFGNLVSDGSIGCVRS